MLDPYPSNYQSNQLSSNSPSFDVRMSNSYPGYNQNFSNNYGNFSTQYQNNSNTFNFNQNQISAQNYQQNYSDADYNNGNQNTSANANMYNYYNNQNNSNNLQNTFQAQLNFTLQQMQNEFSGMSLNSQQTQNNNTQQSSTQGYGQGSNLSPGLQNQEGNNNFSFGNSYSSSGLNQVFGFSASNSQPSNNSGNQLGDTFLFPSISKGSKKNKFHSPNVLDLRETSRFSGTATTTGGTDWSWNSELS